MTQFLRHKTADEIIALCNENKIQIDTANYEAGGDYIAVHLKGQDDTLVKVLYNTFNGCFFHVGKQSSTSFSSDEDRDSQPWFTNMLNFFYVPHPDQSESKVAA